VTFESYGEYQLLKKLASGGMATIFLARQAGIEGFEKLLVVKRILPHLAENDEFIKMFLDEARIAARLNHPNIVQIFNLGAQDDSYFIAMEYIHGEDVRRVFRRAEAAGKSLPVPLICRIIMDAAAGLDYAHHKNDPSGKPLGIVHRDVSPQNILVTFEGSVKVVDFGIAKAADQATVTKSGVLKGKYSYMSPEQAAGGKIDRRTDIFALGIVMWELLTGTRLFKRGNDLQTLEAVGECEVTPPSEIDARLPKQLDDIVLRALEKKLDKRYQTAGELRTGLEQFLLSNQLPSSSVHLGAFMKDVYAERLKREAEEGRVLFEELNQTQDPFVRATPMNLPARKATGASRPGPPVPDDVTRADRSSSLERARDLERERPTQTVPERERNTARTESMSATTQDKLQRGSPLPWVLVLVIAMVGAGTGAFLFLKFTSGATVNISSDPESAAVTFDGKVLSDAITPCTLPKTFPGVHSVALTKRGYVRLETTVTVPARGELTLPPYKLEKEK
jgi:serine/threonine protein kinase